jgi:hypothetical protein
MKKWIGLLSRVSEDLARVPALQEKQMLGQNLRRPSEISLAIGSDSGTAGERAAIFLCIWMPLGHHLVNCSELDDTDRL